MAKKYISWKSILMYCAILFIPWSWGIATVFSFIRDSHNSLVSFLISFTYISLLLVGAVLLSTIFSYLKQHIHNTKQLRMAQSFVWLAFCAAIALVLIRLSGGAVQFFAIIGLGVAFGSISALAIGLGFIIIPVLAIVIGCMYVGRYKEKTVLRRIFSLASGLLILGIIISFIAIGAV